MLRMALPKDAIIRIGRQQLWECLAGVGTVLMSQAGQLGQSYRGTDPFPSVWYRDNSEEHEAPGFEPGSVPY